MSIEKITEDVNKLDGHLYRALSYIHKLEKRVDSQEKSIDQLEKSIKEQNKMISRLTDNLKRLQVAQDKVATNIKADINDLRALTHGKRK